MMVLYEQGVFNRSTPVIWEWPAILTSIVWLVATVAFIVMLSRDVRTSRGYANLRRALTIVYAAVLLWHLFRSAPAIVQQPDLALFARWQYAPFAAALFVALVLCLTAFTSFGVGIFYLLLMAATVVALVAWRRQITLPVAVVGIAVSLIAFVTGGIAFMKHKFVSRSVVYLFLVWAPFLFVAGSLLSSHTGLKGSALVNLQAIPALTSFLLGCLLFFPLGLANAADKRETYAWVRHWWQPLTHPIWSALNEEALFRLFLIPLCYILLNPLFHNHPVYAVIAAALLSGITFGLGHGRSWNRFWLTGLCYGVPMALAFASRDWELAVGAHYIVNFVPWVMVYLKK